MSEWVDSHIEFDFRGALDVVKHDDFTGLPNPSWPGVDFRIIENVFQIWLEVKNWNPRNIAPKSRGGSRRSFLCKMQSKNYVKEMREKFLGTTAYLAWTEKLILKPTYYILLFESSPQGLDSALLVAFMTKLQKQIPNLKIWQTSLHVAVLNLEEWNRRYPEFPAQEQ